MRPQLSKELMKYFQTHEGTWFKKVDLYILADQLGYSPETCGRMLRTLESKGMIQADYYDGRWSKNLVKYCYNAPEPKQAKFEIKEVNGRVVAVYT